MKRRSSICCIVRVLVLGATSVLAACGPAPSPDIKADLQRIRQEAVRARLDPLPEIAPYVPPELRIERDPFARR